MKMATEAYRMLSTMVENLKALYLTVPARTLAGLSYIAEQKEAFVTAIDTMDADAAIKQNNCLVARCDSFIDGLSEMFHSTVMKRIEQALATFDKVSKVALIRKNFPEELSLLQDTASSLQSLLSDWKDAVIDRNQFVAAGLELLSSFYREKQELEKLYGDFKRSIAEDTRLRQEQVEREQAERSRSAAENYEAIMASFNRPVPTFIKKGRSLDKRNADRETRQKMKQPKGQSHSRTTA